MWGLVEERRTVRQRNRAAERARTKKSKATAEIMRGLGSNVPVPSEVAADAARRADLDLKFTPTSLCGDPVGTRHNSNSGLPRRVRTVTDIVRQLHERSGVRKTG